MSKKSISFSDNFTLHETYSKEEYDRSNLDIPSLLIRINARDFGGQWCIELQNIEFELNFIKRTEMKTTYINTMENIKLLKNTF